MFEPGRETRRILVHLNGGPIALELHDLPDEMILAHLDEIEHLRVGDSFRMDDGADDLVHLSDDLKHCGIPLSSYDAPCGRRRRPAPPAYSILSSEEKTPSNMIALISSR